MREMTLWTVVRADARRSGDRGAQCVSIARPACDARDGYWPDRRCCIGGGAATRAAAAPRCADQSDGAQNVGWSATTICRAARRSSTTTKSDAANGNWVYVGHHDSFRDDKPLLNPITGKMEFNGTSILDISDPAKPKLVWHIPNETNRNSRSVSVVYDYKFDSSGRDYLIRNSEALTQGETGRTSSFRSSTSPRGTPTRRRSRWSSEITGTPPNSCGPGCGGKFIMRAHKGWWSQDTGYFYAASGEPGFRNVIVQIFDLKNPKAPKFVGRAWIPGLKDGEPGYEGQYSHHPIVDEENKRLYVGYRNAGGQAASFDISDPAQPKLVWSIDMNPPHRGPHTVSPIVYDKVPNFGQERAAAHLCVHRRRSGRRRRHEAVHERRAHRRRTCSTSRPRRSRSRCRCGRCRSATSARRAAASARTSRPRPSTARSTGSRTRSRGSPTSTPASASSI